MTAVPAPDEASLCWSVGRSRTTANWTAMNDLSWSNFVRWLNPDEPAASKEVSPYVGGTLSNGRRTARTVEQRFLMTLDADYADEDFLLDVALTFPDTPYLIHTTWQHDVGAHRYRLILPLSRGVFPNEYKELAWLIMGRLGGERFDKTTVQAERFMWGPSNDPHRPYHWMQANRGAAYLPVDAWLDGHQRPQDARGAGGRANPPPAPRQSASRLVTTSEDRERAEEIWASAVQDVRNLRETHLFAGRNEAVFHLLPLLLRFADAGLLDEDAVIASLYEAAQSVPADEAYTQVEFQASVRSARQYADEQGPLTPDSTPTKRAQDDFEDVVVEGEEEDLWSLTPQLRHIAQAADNIGCSRASMLAATLLRILVQVEPSVQLAGSKDGSVGSRAALNLGVVLVGASGQGKSTVSDASAELVPGSSRFQNSKMATGQGLIQTYLRWDEEAQENVLIDEPNALFWFDEIDVLAATSADSSNTVLSEVRTMMTGGQTGTQTATANRKRTLKARSYNFQLAINAQPSRTGVLLNDRDGGTPQRFIWTPVIDKSNVVHPKDRPSWPGPLEWDNIFLMDFEFGLREVVDIPQWVKEELLDYDYHMRLEGMEGGPLSRDSHKGLLRLKVAVGIAFLHQSPEVTDQHMHIADLVVKDSYRIQRECERIIATTEFKTKLAKAESDARVIDVTNDKKFEALMKTAVKKLRAHKDWMLWRDLRPAHRDRETWSERIQEELVRMDEVETEATDTGFRARWVG